MTEQFTLDLEALAGAHKQPYLSGKQRGRDARSEFKLEELDTRNAVVHIIAPEFLTNVSSSFTLGLLSQSLAALGEEFWNRYVFEGKQSIIEQMTKALTRGEARMPTLH